MSIITEQYPEDFNATMGKYRAESIADFFKNTTIKSIADIGCGPGDIVEHLEKISDIIQKSEHITGIDADQHYLNKMRDKFRDNPKFHFITLNVESEPLPQTTYDVILLIDLLEHLNDPAAFLKNIQNHLNPCGHIVIIVPNAYSIHRLIGKEMGFIKDVHELGPTDFKVGHKRYFDTDSLEKLISANGLKTILRSGILLKFQPNKQLENLPSEHCDALYRVGLQFPQQCGELFFVCQAKN